jgi:hypothetical protein
MPAIGSCIRHGVPPALPFTSHLRAYRVVRPVCYYILYRKASCAQDVDRQPELRRKSL